MSILILLLQCSTIDNEFIYFTFSNREYNSLFLLQIFVSVALMCTMCPSPLANKTRYVHHEP
jgi:hypothetical protein